MNKASRKTQILQVSKEGDHDGRVPVSRVALCGREVVLPTRPGRGRITSAARIASREGHRTRGRATVSGDWPALAAVGSYQEVPAGQPQHTFMLSHFSLLFCPWVLRLLLCMCV